MEATDLFKVLADYLNFVVDIMLFRGMEKYARSGLVNSELVSFFVAGVLVAYLVASLKRFPGYEEKLAPQEQAPAGEAQDGAKLDAGPQHAEQKNEIVGFVVVSILGAIVFHGLLVLHHKVWGERDIGNVKDTLNAVLAVSAVYNPLNAVFKKIGKTAKQVGGIPGVVVLLTLMAAYLGGMYYWVYALAAVHRTTRMYMLGAGATPVCLAGVLLVLSSRAKGQVRPPNSGLQQT